MRHTNWGQLVFLVSLLLLPFTLYLIGLSAEQANQETGLTPEKEEKHTHRCNQVHEPVKIVEPQPLQLLEVGTKQLGPATLVTTYQHWESDPVLQDINRRLLEEGAWTQLYRNQLCYDIMFKKLNPLAKKALQQYALDYRAGFYVRWGSYAPEGDLITLEYQACLNGLPIQDCYTVIIVNVKERRVETCYSTVARQLPNNWLYYPRDPGYYSQVIDRYDGSKATHKDVKVQHFDDRPGQGRAHVYYGFFRGQWRQLFQTVLEDGKGYLIDAATGEVLQTS